MKHIIYKACLFAAIGSAMVACDENAWNDHLDGFDGNPEITQQQTIEYTLTDADYAAIASNATNKALAEKNGVADALAALSTTHCFTAEIPAADYVPAFLASSSFQYFTLSTGSSVKLTYNTAEAAPSQVAEYAGAEPYTLTTDDYIEIWGSDDNFINGFAPSHTAVKGIPLILSNWYDDAENGTCLLVTYQQTDQEPVFGNVGEQEKTYTNTKVTDMAEGVYAMVADGNAVYTPQESYSYGYFKAYEVAEDGTGINLDATQQTCNFTFTAVTGGYTITDIYGRYVYQDDSHDSFQLSKTDPADGSQIWTVEPQTDGSMKVTNTLRGKYIQYDPAYSSCGSYATERGVMPTFYKKNAEASKAVAKAPVAQVPLTALSAIWKLTEGTWAVPADAVVLQRADYTAMGQKYANLSGSLPQQLLPTFLAGNYPYAVEGDQKFVVYQYYNGTTTATQCSAASFDGTKWTVFEGEGAETSQFVLKTDGWKYDPSVTINLPAGKGQEMSTLYFQTCVDWVYEAIDVPLGSTGIKSGLGYVTSYGNNEYYSGTSAYQGNVDIRAAKAKEQYAKGYEGMDDDQITELMKKRFCLEVFPAALEKLHSDAAPVEGLDVTYTINFAYYTGSTSTAVLRYKVVDKAKFEFLDCTWWESGQPAE